MKITLLIISFFTISSNCISQIVIDTINTIKLKNNTENINTKTKSLIWGNSTYISTAINLNKKKEFEFNIGRTNGKEYGDKDYEGIPAGYYTISSYGIGYGFAEISNQKKQLVKAFYEFTFFPYIFIGNFVVRNEFIYNITDNQNYLRPLIGLSFFYVDISYNYSFLLNGKKSENFFRDGITIRLKYFTKKKNWTKIKWTN